MDGGGTQKFSEHSRKRKHVQGHERINPTGGFRNSKWGRGAGEATEGADDRGSKVESLEAT